MSRLIFDNLGDARELLLIDREALAYYLLEHLHALGGKQQHSHPGNLANSIASHYPPQFRDEIRKSVFSACKWLVLREYLAEVNNQGFFEMSESGKRMTLAADRVPESHSVKTTSREELAPAPTDGSAADSQGDSVKALPMRSVTSKAFHESATLASWVFGGLILMFLMLVVFVDVNQSKFPIIRFLMALSAGFFAIFFVGGILLKGTLRGLLISATGGFVLFVLIQFVVDPFQVLPTPASSTSTPVSASPSPTATATVSSKSYTSPSSKNTTPNLGQTNTPTTGRGTAEESEIRETLRDAEALIQTGNASDKEKALQLYLGVVKRLKLNHRKLDQGLLRGAEDDYAHHFDDNARGKYKALLEAYLRTNSAPQPEK